MLGKISSLTEVVNSLRENGVRGRQLSSNQPSDDNADRKLRHHRIRPRPNAKMGNRVVLRRRAITRRMLLRLRSLLQPTDRKARVYHGFITLHFTASCPLATPFANRLPR